MVVLAAIALVVVYLMIGFLGAVATMAASFYKDKKTPRYYDLYDCVPMMLGGPLMPILAIVVWSYALFDRLKAKGPNKYEEIKWWPWKY